MYFLFLTNHEGFLLQKTKLKIIGAPFDFMIINEKTIYCETMSSDGYFNLTKISFFDNSVKDKTDIGTYIVNNNKNWMKEKQEDETIPFIDENTVNNDDDDIDNILSSCRNIL